MAATRSAFVPLLSLCLAGFATGAEPTRIDVRGLGTAPTQE
jgi:hypothetical protein